MPFSHTLRCSLIMWTCIGSYCLKGDFGYPVGLWITLMWIGTLKWSLSHPMSVCCSAASQPVWESWWLDTALLANLSDLLVARTWITMPMGPGDCEWSVYIDGPPRNTAQCFETSLSPFQIIGIVNAVYQLKRLRNDSECLCHCLPFPFRRVSTHLNLG